MPTSPILLRKAAVLGAGVMGAQIAAHFANAGIPALLFDLPAKEGDHGDRHQGDRQPRQARARAARGEGPRRGHRGVQLRRDLALLAECDLVIEAIGERLDWKRDLYGRSRRISRRRGVRVEHVGPVARGAVGDAARGACGTRFCGIHFFNPPRYMHLVELIAHAATDGAISIVLETFLTTTLGKGVIRAQGHAQLHRQPHGHLLDAGDDAAHAGFGLGFDVVDALTGPAIGRAKSATYRTADVVGLDTLAHVDEDDVDTLPDDPWHACSTRPPVLAGLVAQGALGAKDEGRLLPQGRQGHRGARPRGAASTRRRRRSLPEVAAILKIESPAEQFAKLRASAHPQAQFLWAIFRDLFHYGAYHLADDRRQRARRRPRDALGLRLAAGTVRDVAGRGMAAWRGGSRRHRGRQGARQGAAAAVGDGPDERCGGVHAATARTRRRATTFAPRSTLPVYARQLLPRAGAGREPASSGTTSSKTTPCACGTCGDDVGIVSFKSKVHTVGAGVLDGILRAIDDAEREFAGLVIWQTREPFSLGANLAELGPAIEGAAVGRDRRRWWRKFQRTASACGTASCRRSPRCAAWRSAASCEFIMHATRTVAALESYIGLVEAGVGLLPAGGGCKELAVRAADEAKRGAAAARSTCSPSSARISRRSRWRRCRRARSRRRSWASCGRPTSW